MVRKSMRVAKTARRSSRASARLDVDVPVSKLMIADPLCVGPELSGALARLLMLDQGVSALPVVDETGRPIGMLSRGDCDRRGSRRSSPEGDADDVPLCRPGALDPESEAGSLRALESYVAGVDEPKVGELMSPGVLSVPAETPVVEAARLMIEHDVQHLAVTGPRRKLVGLLSALDLVRAIAQVATTPQLAGRSSSRSA